MEGSIGHCWAGSLFSLVNRPSSLGRSWESLPPCFIPHAAFPVATSVCTDHTHLRTPIRFFVELHWFGCQMLWTWPRIVEKLPPGRTECLNCMCPRGWVKLQPDFIAPEQTAIRRRPHTLKPRCIRRARTTGVLSAVGPQSLQLFRGRPWPRSVAL